MAYTWKTSVHLNIMTYIIPHTNIALKKRRGIPPPTPPISLIGARDRNIRTKYSEWLDNLNLRQGRRYNVLILIACINQFNKSVNCF